MKKVALLMVVGSLGLAVVAPAVSDAKPTAHSAKKCKKKHGKKKCKKAAAPAPPFYQQPPAPPTPLPLSSAEVINQVVLKAGQYCSSDPYCYDWGYYYDTAIGDPYCVAKTTYLWSCDGWNAETDTIYGGYTCDFREVVERVGYSGIKSEQDTAFGDGGWDCY